MKDINNMKGIKKFNREITEETKKFNEDVIEFLKHSNWIEGEYDERALEDAINAWDWAFHNKDDKIGIQYILKIHQLLMRRIRPDIAGQIRNCGVWIGGQHKPFINKAIIESELLMGVCFEMLARGTFDKEERAKKIHVAFENIHPFEDGNGRVGRILYNINRLKFGLPIHIIHQGDEQQEYYKWFR